VRINQSSASATDNNLASVSTPAAEARASSSENASVPVADDGECFGCADLSSSVDLTAVSATPDKDWYRATPTAVRKYVFGWTTSAPNAIGVSATGSDARQEAVAITDIGGMVDGGFAGLPFGIRAHIPYRAHR
jgi:hypothetical protein